MLKKLDSMLIAVCIWVVRQFELFTPMSHAVLTFGAKVATWWYALPSAVLTLGFFLEGEWLWFIFISAVFFHYLKQTWVLGKIMKYHTDKALLAKEVTENRLLFRLLPLLNMNIFAFAAQGLAGNPETKFEYECFFFLAIASFIVLAYELLACVGPIKKRQRK